MRADYAVAGFILSWLGWIFGSAAAQQSALPPNDLGWLVYGGIASALGLSGLILFILGIATSKPPARPNPVQSPPGGYPYPPPPSLAYAYPAVPSALPPPPPPP